MIMNFSIYSYQLFILALKGSSSSPLKRPFEEPLPLSHHDFSLFDINWACRNLDHAESGFINNFSWIFWTQQQ